MRFFCFLLLTVPAFAQSPFSLDADRIVIDKNFSLTTSNKEWSLFERELDNAASLSQSSAFNENEKYPVLAKVAGPDVIRIRILNARPSLINPDKSSLATAQDEIKKVWNGPVWELSTYRGWSEGNRWNVYAAIDYLSGAEGLLLTDGWHIGIKTATGQVRFTRLAPLPQNQ